MLTLTNTKCWAKVPKKAAWDDEAPTRSIFADAADMLPRRTHSNQRSYFERTRIRQLDYPKCCLSLRVPGPFFTLELELGLERPLSAMLKRVCGWKLAEERTPAMNLHIATLDNGWWSEAF